MVNSIAAGRNELVFVDYSDLLAKILQILRRQSSQKLFNISDDRQRLLIDINAVASQVASLQVDNPLSGSTNSVKTATVCFSPGFQEKFPSQLQQLVVCLNQLLKNSISQGLSSQSVQDFVGSLVTDLQTLKGDTASLNLTYPFNSYQDLQKQRLTFANTNAQEQELLRFHKLTITVLKTSEFNEQLREALEQYIKVQFLGISESEREDLGYVLEDLHKDKDKPECDFYRLKHIIDTQTLGKLKKQAQINYLEFLYENISTAHPEAVIDLQDMIRRLKLIEEYIHDSNKADGDYLVSYAGVSLNYRDIFSRAEAFEMLPIIPKIEGYLGETKDEEKGEIQFIFGLKLKFDGKVQTDGGKTVFEYYLNLLNPDSEEHQTQLQDPLQKETFAKKVLRIAFLYYFLFASQDASSKLAYNPIAGFEKNVLLILQSDDDAKKRKIFQGIIKGFTKFDIPSKIKNLKVLLSKVIKQLASSPTRAYPLHISLSKGILETDFHTITQQNTFFKPVLRGNPKEVLKYITIGEANAKPNSLCTLPAKITISDIHYAATDERQSFSMEYDISGIKTLPVLILPLQNQTCQLIYQKYFKKTKLILFTYRLEAPLLDSSQLFIYRFTFSLLAYICLKILLKEQNRLFIPILRFHLHNKEDDAPIEKFIVSFSQVLSHLLNEEHRANTQGVDIRNLNYKIPNVLSSLYSVLPKKFTFSNPLDSPQSVDKLAIIIVSSRESDRTWHSTQKLSNLMGEVVSLKYQNGCVRVQLLKTFSGNYDYQQMFKQPMVVIDEVAKLYQKGYRHFAYIAKAPYTSTLHMTQTEDSEHLYFLSKEVIKAFKAQHDDIKIYPMFFDKYYAVKLPGKIGVSSLYIQDTAELTNIVDDPSQRSVVFFNLFNGITIGKKEERYYNGVISYSTLLKIYDGILNDEDIYKGLIFKGQQKNDILQYLTLFHFSRYEKANQINLKLDPYENLIGDASVGSHSLFSHMRGKGEFNLLAFLTEVRRIFNIL